MFTDMQVCDLHADVTPNSNIYRHAKTRSACRCKPQPSTHRHVE